MPLRLVVCGISGGFLKVRVHISYDLILVLERADGMMRNTVRCILIFPGFLFLSFLWVPSKVKRKNREGASIYNDRSLTDDSLYLCDGRHYQSPHVFVAITRPDNEWHRRTRYHEEAVIFFSFHDSVHPWHTTHGASIPAQVRECILSFSPP